MTKTLSLPAGKIASLKKGRGFEEVREERRKTEGEIILPTRGSKTSAGYDFYSTEGFTVIAICEFLKQAPKFRKEHWWQKHKFELLNENNLDKEIDLETWEFTKEVVKDEQTYR